MASEYNDTRNVDETDFAVMTAGSRKLKIGDIIYSRNASVGAAARVEADREFCIGQDICLIRSQAEDFQVVEFQLNSDFISTHLESILLDSTFKRVNVEKIKNFIIVVPSEVDRVKLFEYLDFIIGELDSVADAVLSAILKLTEYRSALITAAVTGQIDVRGWRPPA